MVNMTLLPRSRPLTRTDLDAIPDDGRRYELVDGALVVTPAPSRKHQAAVVELTYILRGKCPEDLQVLVAPFDVVISELTVVQPDLLVARRADFTERDLPMAPLLAVEVLSPSTRHLDLSLKKASYEAAGCPSYWVVDPATPSLTAWELRDGAYVEIAHVIGDERFTAARPYPVELVPAELLD